MRRILGIATGKNEPLNHRLTDRTLAGVAARADATRKRLAELKALDLTDLGKPAHLDAAVAQAAHEIAAEGYAFGFGDPLNLDPNIGYRNPPYVVNQLGGAYVDFPDFLDSRHTVATEQDAVAYADRVDAYAKDLDGETERLTHDRGMGVVAPDFTLDKTIKIIGGGAAEKVDQTIVVTSLEKSLTKAGLDAKILDRVKQSMTTGVLPALQRQLEELKQHRAVATSDAGVSHFKNGDAYYQWALKAGDDDDPLAAGNPPARARPGQDDPVADGRHHAKAGPDRRDRRRAHVGPRQGPGAAFPEHRGRA